MRPEGEAMAPDPSDDRVTDAPPPSRRAEREARSLIVRWAVEIIKSGRGGATE